MNVYNHIEEEELENTECPICGKPDAGGVPCSLDCLKADIL